MFSPVVQAKSSTELKTHLEVTPNDTEDRVEAPKSLKCLETWQMSQWMFQTEITT